MIWKNVSTNANWEVLANQDTSAQLLCPKFKRTCNATVGLHGQRPDPQNKAIGTKFWHLVVNTNQMPYEHLITKQPHSHITGQNRLQTPGAPTRSALGPTSISSPS
ncbi:hypothetical protein M9H77_04300 [Catharanthus roseus]|uniref:Uncharacterized protein n=1 Tax=Catharanthus roseus TaxID=4058 RepID=A0ACC0CDY0_CATRO|nr:hypothetical protein M9H77_04300 [Catharanthus roseus]